MTTAAAERAPEAGESLILCEHVAAYVYDVEPLIVATRQLERVLWSVLLHVVQQPRDVC